MGAAVDLNISHAKTRGSCYARVNPKSRLPCGFLRSCFEYCIPYCMPLNDRKIMGIYSSIEDDAEKIIVLFSLLYDYLGLFECWVKSYVESVCSRLIF